jgi:hypothetical protein
MVKAKMVQEGSAHLDNTKKETKAAGERKHHTGTLMEGIVPGLTKKVSPPIIDGIVRGISKHEHLQSSKEEVTKVQGSATKNSAASFGVGMTPEHAR